MATGPFLPFLHPLPLPRQSSINALRRQISSLPRLRQTVPKARLPPLPYHVHRTASQKLPIYHLAKRGGNLHQTRIRKIEGNVEKLRDEIVATLALKEDTVVINRLTGHIIIKGWYKNDIKRFLEERHF